MRKYAPLVALLLAVFLIGCGAQPAPETGPTTAPAEIEEPTDVPSPAPSSEVETAVVPSPTTASEEATDLPVGEPEAAVCVEAEAEFPTQPGLPPVSEDDHTKGPSDAPITVIEYSDFQ